MNFIQAVDKACEQPTLLDALTWICVWHCEDKAVEAHKFLNNEKPRGPDGEGWNTCFKFIIKETMEAYTIKRLKGN